MPGQFILGNRNFESHKILLELETSLLIRKIQYPVTIKIDCIVSDQIPLAGVITCRYDVKIQRGDQVLGKSLKQIDLLDFFRG